MPPILTAEDVVRRIAAECAFVDEPGGVGIRLRAGSRDRVAVRRAIPSAAAPQASAPFPQAADAAVRRSFAPIFCNEKSS